MSDDGGVFYRQGCRHLAAAIVTDAVLVCVKDHDPDKRADAEAFLFCSWRGRLFLDELGINPTWLQEQIESGRISYTRGLRRLLLSAARG